MGNIRFQRPLGNRPYRKLYLIVAEGSKTEPQYFSMFNSDEAYFRVKCYHGKHASAPPQLLKLMTAQKKSEGLKLTDEAWIVVDKDTWTDLQLLELDTWANTSANHGLALSNPQFEYWLLLHFEDGNGISSSKDCLARLLRHLPNFEKGSVDTRKLRLGVTDAVTRAKRRDNPPCGDWPKTTGSTVYRLVEKIQ